MRRRGVRRLSGGAIEVRLGAGEREALESLAEQLLPVLRGEADVDTPAGSVAARLFPAGYEDPLEEMEFRELVGEEVRATRTGALEAFIDTLRGGRSGPRGWTIELDGEQADAWLSAINDSRLTLGMIAGVQEERDWQTVHARGDVTAALLAYLGWLQEELLAVLLGGLPDPD